LPTNTPPCLVTSALEFASGVNYVLVRACSNISTVGVPMLRAMKKLLLLLVLGGLLAVAAKKLRTA
jgi:hypothetical protein